VIIVAEKVKELATYQSEIKALKTTEALKDKAIVEVFLLNSSNTNSPFDQNTHPLGLCLGIGKENCSS
jgi:aspartate carbamoyltransferase catalytic subunit